MEARLTPGQPGAGAREASLEPLRLGLEFSDGNTLHHSNYR
jgi:hypothetical protein